MSWTGYVMGDYWVDDMFDVLAAAGCGVAVNDINEGWERRSRSSGGFDAAPLGVQWHHTASSASVNSDLGYMINGSPDRPVGNVLLDRTGVFWPVAAGAANTSGKGGPNTFTRGVCPLDKGNTKLFSIEIACDGVGEPYSQATIDAAFAGSNALNARFGNQPTDVITHALGAGDGWTDRKIDPATTNVQGPWQPSSVNTSGTWSLSDLRAECALRAAPVPAPTPPPLEEPMSAPATTIDTGGDPWVVFLANDGGLHAKHADDLAFGLGRPDGVTLTTDIAAVPGARGQLYVWVYADDGSVWLRHWPGLSHDWDPWWQAG